MSPFSFAIWRRISRANWFDFSGTNWIFVSQQFLIWKEGENRYGMPQATTEYSSNNRPKAFGKHSKWDFALQIELNPFGFVENNSQEIKLE